MASLYLEETFKDIGLKPMNASYFQSFQYNTNTFQGRVSVSLNGKKINTGIDFILNAASGSGHGTYKIFKLDSSIFYKEESLRDFLQYDLSMLVVAYPTKWQKLFYERSPDLIQKIHQSKGIVQIETGKLTMTISEQAYQIPCIQILKSVFENGDNEISFTIENTYIKNYTAKNLIGCVEGTSHKDSFLFVTAHYDHLGTLGKKVYFPGANDNASGIAMLLELAKNIKAKPLKYTVVFIAFAGEEAGLLGSTYFVKNPLVELSKIKFLVNLDLLGTGEDGIMVVNGTIFKKEVEKLVQINSDSNFLLKQIKTRGAAANSDHYPFYNKGVPCFFIYTLGGVAAYHDVQDIEKTLPLTAFTNVFELLSKFLETF
jgi:aminopeptidase YwaD